MSTRMRNRRCHLGITQNESRIEDHDRNAGNSQPYHTAGAEPVAPAEIVSRNNKSHRQRPQVDRFERSGKFYIASGFRHAGSFRLKFYCLSIVIQNIKYKSLSNL